MTRSESVERETQRSVHLTLCAASDGLILRASNQKPEDNRPLANRQGFLVCQDLGAIKSELAVHSL